MISTCTLRRLEPNINTGWFALTPKDHLEEEDEENEEESEK